MEAKNGYFVKIVQKKKDGSANTQAQYIFDLADVLLSPLL